MTTILAGDIGGTSTRLRLFDVGEQRELSTQVFRSGDFDGLAPICQQFLSGRTIDAAAFGIAGPVLDGRVATTNLPWLIEGAQLGRQLGTERVALLNDLEALALGALHLPRSSLHVLQTGVPRQGTIAVVAAGTGLGQAQLFWDGKRHIPGATEGGHVEFAPHDDQDQALLVYARRRLEALGAGQHVSWERLVSGPGLGWIFDFLVASKACQPDPQVLAELSHADPGSVIGKAAVEQRCPASEQAVQWFVRLYARQAGNFALSILATGGVLLGGGIAPKILPLLTGDHFRKQFADKGRYVGLLQQIPIAVVLDQNAGLLGAQVAATQLLTN